MTIFITESFKIDLTHLNIRFSEKNSFFHTDLIKQHSFPFKIPLERNFISFYNFVASHNSTASNKNIKGKLFRVDRFYDAELQILKISNSIESVFYINIEKLLILKQPLKSLPWPSIDIGNSIYEFAYNNKNETYPTTKINFTEIYHPELHESNEWGPYSGFINECNAGVFIEDYFTTAGVHIYKMAEIRPFIYLKEIIVFIFSQINYTVIGDFMTDEYLNKALYYNKEPIFYTNASLSTKEIIDLTFLEEITTDESLFHNIYHHVQTIYDLASYKIKITVKGEWTYEGEYCRLSCYYNGSLLSGSNRYVYNDSGSEEFNIDIDLLLNLTNETVGQDFEIRVETISETLWSIEVEKTVTGTDRPLYKPTIDLIDLVPDMSISNFIESVKETFNLSSVVNNLDQTVRLDFLKLDSDPTKTVNISTHQNPIPSVKLNKTLGYSIPFTNGETVYLDKQGEYIEYAIDFKDKKVPLEPLPIEHSTEVLSVKHQEGNSILFYDNDFSAKPFIGDSQVYFSRKGFIHYYLRKWFYRQLNSQFYSFTIHLPVFLSSKIDSEKQIAIYNNYFLVENINRSQVGPLFEKLTFNLFKMTSIPSLEFEFDEVPGGEVILPPDIITSISAGDNTSTDNYSAIFIDGSRDNALSYYEADIFANFTADPQGQILSFYWQLISGPIGYGNAEFVQQNANNSITKFRVYGSSAITENFVVELKVRNTSGLESTKEITIIPI